MKTAILMVISLFLMACQSMEVWTVERSENGGVVGYRNYEESEKGRQKLRSAIHCQDFKIVNDRLVNGGTRTAYMPMQSTNYATVNSYGNVGGYNYSGTSYGTSTQTNYVPYQYNVTWREATYVCGQSQTQSISTSDSGLSKKDSCQNECSRMYASNMLKKGETAETCNIKLCSSL